MGKPSTAVKLMVVATLRPPLIAHMLAPLPKWATMILARELKLMREENAKLKRIVADVAGQGDAPGRPSKKVLRPVKKREMAKYLMGRYSVSAKKACRCLILHRSAYY